MILILWVILTFVVAFLGKERKIGFGGAFLSSLLLSPVIGLIITFASEPLKKERRISDNEPYKIIPNQSKSKSKDPQGLSPEATKLIREGQSRIKTKDYDGAIEKFETVLGLMPVAPNSNYQLATLYSAKEEKDKAYKYLTRAIEQGFDDFKELNSNSLLSFLRNQPEFKEYVQNGYKFPVSALNENDVIAKLEKLGNLKASGVLTEEEFADQKRKLLEA